MGDCGRFKIKEEKMFQYATGKIGRPGCATWELVAISL